MKRKFLELGIVAVSLMLFGGFYAARDETPQLHRLTIGEPMLTGQRILLADEETGRKVIVTLTKFDLEMIVVSATKGYVKTKLIASWSEEAHRIELTKTGNLQVLDINDQLIWSSETEGKGTENSFLAIKPNADLVIYKGTWLGGKGPVIWSAGTAENWDEIKGFE